jgi:hypothetical protein
MLYTTLSLDVLDRHTELAERKPRCPHLGDAAIKISVSGRPVIASGQCCTSKFQLSNLRYFVDVWKVS